MFRDFDYLLSPDVDSRCVAWVSEILGGLVSVCSVDRELWLCHRSSGGWLVGSGCCGYAVGVSGTLLFSRYLLGDGRCWCGLGGCGGCGPEGGGSEGYRR